jgi:DNA-binding transcriptional LysR family regulator
MLPSGSDLTYFVEAATSLNVSRAAERLGIAQPSLTLALQRLEHSLGTELFIRSKRGLQLTQAGKQLLLHTRDLLQRWEVVRGKAIASSQKAQGIYSVGCHVSVALYSLPHFLADILNDHPRLEVKLVHDLSRKITERVIRGEIDLGIVVNPVRHPDLVIHKLCDDEVGLWKGKGQRRVQDFSSGEAVLICDSDMLQAQTLLKKIKKDGTSFRRILTSSSLEVVTLLTESGAGVGIIPGRVASRVSSLRRVVGAPSFRDEICVLYRAESKGVKAIQTIVGEVIRAFRN